MPVYPIGNDKLNYYNSGKYKYEESGEGANDRNYVGYVWNENGQH